MIAYKGKAGPPRPLSHLKKMHNNFERYIIRLSEREIKIYTSTVRKETVEIPKPTFAVKQLQGIITDKMNKLLVFYNNLNTIDESRTNFINKNKTKNTIKNLLVLRWGRRNRCYTKITDHTIIATRDRFGSSLLPSPNHTYYKEYKATACN